MRRPWKRLEVVEPSAGMAPVPDLRPLNLDLLVLCFGLWQEAPSQRGNALSYCFQITHLFLPQYVLQSRESEAKNCDTKNPDPEPLLSKPPEAITW